MTNEEEDLLSRNSKPVGWGIVGAGKLADLAIAPPIVAQPESRLAAVCSRDLGRAQAFAERHGGAAAYDDYRRMLKDPDVDVVYIASPNALHFDQTIAALRAGKHVLVEKPMALSPADGRAMVQTARDLGRLLGVGFHLRHKPSNQVARKAVAEGRLGRVFFAELELGAGKGGHFPYDTWRADHALAGGGTVINQGTHMIDLARFLTGQEIVSVTAAVDHFPLEDVMTAVCRLANGALASLASQQLHAGTRQDFVLLGEDGWIQGFGATSPNPNDAMVHHVRGGQTKTPGSAQSAYWHEVEAFDQAVLGRAPVNGDGEDGLRNIAVVEAIYRSAREGRAVEVEAGG